MRNDIEKVLLDEEVIRKRTQYLGKRIEEDYNSEDIDVISVVLVLKGALPFAADLLRSIDKRITVDCVNASSYKGQTESCGVVAIDHIPDVLNKDVLLIDDILDTGLTMMKVREALLQAGAASVTGCVLLDKSKAGPQTSFVEYVGFQIPDEFVVGYGLDFQGHYRNLPYIGILKKGVDSEETGVIMSDV